MKRRLTSTLIIIVLVCSLASCNFPGLASDTTPTAPPTKTLPPPTHTASPAPPTNTPEPPTPTATIAIVFTPTNFPTSTQSIPPTKPVIIPMGSAKFLGTFDSGTFTFRTNSKGTYVTLKQIILKKAVCSTGQKVSRQLTYEDVQFFTVLDGKFTISFDSATVSGQFSSPTNASGSIWISLIDDKCKVGPLFWTAIVTE